MTGLHFAQPGKPFRFGQGARAGQAEDAPLKKSGRRLYLLKYRVVGAGDAAHHLGALCPNLFMEQFAHPFAGLGMITFGQGRRAPFKGGRQRCHPFTQLQKMFNKASRFGKDVFHGLPVYTPFHRCHVQR
ncbi:MAG: hypothetical protein BWX80_04053 [Candidatus Hydrogenedentes bacterium ADurb.Bin101]|nr:MAG: hypothetical protein BWX80_04053 [Candidatus Hydrogenedentes bacterium ADurb.Bin101]